MQVMLIAEMPKQKSSIEIQKKKKNHIMCEIGGRQSLLFLFFFFENKN